MPEGACFSQSFEPLNDGSNLRKGLLCALDPQCETAQWTKLSCEQFISLPWLVRTSNIRLWTSPHWFKDVVVEDERDKNGVYVALELGPAVFSGQRINQSNFNCAPEVHCAFESSRLLVTRNTLHITLGYLPRLDRDIFSNMETHLSHIIGCWKQYICTNMFEHLSECCRYWMVHEWVKDHTGEDQRFTHPSLETFDGKRWTDMQLCIEDIVSKIRSVAITNKPLALDTEKSDYETVQRIVHRDKKREDYHNSIIQGYQHKLEQSRTTLDEAYTVLSYMHASNPSKGRDQDDCTDTRLDCCVSFKLRFLLDMLEAGLRHTVKSQLLAKKQWKDFGIIKNKSTWHVTPCEDIWLGPPAQMEHAFEDNWRQQHGMSHGLFGEPSSWNSGYHHSENATLTDSVAKMLPCNHLETNRVSDHSFFLKSPIDKDSGPLNRHQCAKKHPENQIETPATDDEELLPPPPAESYEDYIRRKLASAT